MLPPPPSTKLFSGGFLAGGRYRLVRELGSGGNGVIWLALHTGMNAEIVIKFPRHWSRTSDAARQQLQQEAQALAAFSNRHPHIVNILDVGEAQGRPFVVMQYLRRGSLEDCCRGTARSAEVYAKLRSSHEWVATIADVLDFVHQEKLLHRDVKPGNVLLDDSFSAYLGDFGLASSVDVDIRGEARSVGVAGSLPYMAPELLLGRSAVPASDQFALAVSVYEFLVGSTPFLGTAASELLASQKTIAGHGLSSIDSSAPVRAVLARALSWDESSRYATCREFAKELERAWPPFVATPMSEAEPPSETERHSAIAAATTAASSGPRPPPTTKPTSTSPTPSVPPRKIKLRQFLDDEKSN